MDISVITNKIAELKALWDAITSKNNVAAGKFIIEAVDELINFVEVQFQVPGADKKEIVINAIDELYDYAVAGHLPLLLKPFSGMIKRFLINTIVSVIIDHFVAKYNDGSWSKPLAS